MNLAELVKQNREQIDRMFKRVTDIDYSSFTDLLLVLNIIPSQHPPYGEGIIC
jgi:hypothetical protein